MNKKFKSQKSWREKLEHPPKELPKVVTIPPKMQKRFGKGTMLIPKPLDVDALIRTVKKGKLITQAQIREKLAGDFKADTTCPITTGIFVRIVAEAAEEDLLKGKKLVTPYWRVVKNDGSLHEKFPGGIQKQAQHLKEEGFIIEKTKKGNKELKAKDFENYLQKI